MLLNEGVNMKDIRYDSAEHNSRGTCIPWDNRGETNEKGYTFTRNHKGKIFTMCFKHFYLSKKQGIVCNVNEIDDAWTECQWNNKSTN